VAAIGAAGDEDRRIDALGLGSGGLGAPAARRAASAATRCAARCPGPPRAARPGARLPSAQPGGDCCAVGGSSRSRQRCAVRVLRIGRASRISFTVWRVSPVPALCAELRLFCVQVAPQRVSLVPARWWIIRIIVILHLFDRAGRERWGPPSLSTWVEAPAPLTIRDPRAGMERLPEMTSKVTRLARAAGMEDPGRVVTMQRNVPIPRCPNAPGGGRSPRNTSWRYWPPTTRHPTARRARCCAGRVVFQPHHRVAESPRRRCVGGSGRSTRT